MNNATNKQETIKILFDACKTPEERYELIILLGKKLPPMNPLSKTTQNLVDGCQSKLYLHSLLIESTLQFECDSDSLISKGLAAILMHLYNDETPEHILKNPPTILADLNIFVSLSPTRAHGLRSLYLKMQKFALQHLV